MQELITRLTDKASISAEQAGKAIDTIKDFVKEKFPMMSGAVDNLFAASSDATTHAGIAAKAPGSESVLDKISDVIPGKAGEKVEQFVKVAADKAEDLFDSAKEKVAEFRHSETGEKVEDFAKKAAGKAEDLFDSAKEKLGEVFNKEKK